MQDITREFLAEQIKTNNKFFEIYPELTADIEKYRKSPNCGSCRAVLDKIQKDDINKLKKIFGDNIQIVNPPPPKIRIPTMVFEKMTLEEYEKFISNYRIMTYPIVPNAMYIPELKQVWVTYIEHKEKK